MSPVISTMQQTSAMSWLLGLVLCTNLLVVVRGVCTTEGIPGDHPVVKAGLECSLGHQNDRLCVADCIGIKLGMINEKGEYNPKKVVELLDLLPDSELKTAMYEIWNKCAKAGDAPPIDRTVPNCAGFMKIAKCARKVMEEKCPNLMSLLQP